MFASRLLSILAMILMVATAKASTADVKADLLRGSPLLQQKQNQEADRENLPRIENDFQLSQLERAGRLVPLPRGQMVRIDRRLDRKWQWCRPETADFIRTFSADHFATFHRQIQINSAVRTIEYQTYLSKRKRNVNAAPTFGPERSSHLTGATIDIAKKYMSRPEIEWTRTFLVELADQGCGVAIEEYHQAVFHVMVFRSCTVEEVKK